MLADLINSINTPFVLFKILFFIALAATVTVFGFLTMKSGRRRTDAAAQRRVGKMLSKLLHRRGRLLRDNFLPFDNSSQVFDFAVVDAQGVLLVRCVGWGVRVMGGLRDATWKLEDKHRSAVIDNPLLPMQRGIVAVLGHLSAENIHKVSVKPLLVFADPVATAQIMLGKTDEVIALENLSSLMHRRRDGSLPPAEIFRIAAAIEGRRIWHDQNKQF